MATGCFWSAFDCGGCAICVVSAFPNLGLIIVDEEHDASYKQEDQTAYQARDMALLRAKISNIPIILASATPSLESWVNAGVARQDSAGHKDWHQHILSSRFGSASLPDVQLVDMRLSRPPRGQWLSQDLQEALKQTLAAGEQSLLFLNPARLCPGNFVFIMWSSSGLSSMRFFAGYASASRARAMSFLRHQPALVPAMPGL